MNGSVRTCGADYSLLCVWLYIFYVSLLHYTKRLLLGLLLRMFRTLQRMFSGGDTQKNGKGKGANTGGTKSNKARSNNDDFSFIPVTDSSVGLSTTQNGDGSSYMNNMNNIINSQRVYSSSHSRSKPEVQESDEVRLSTNSTQGQEGAGHSFDESMPKKKRRSRSQQNNTTGKKPKSSRRKSTKSTKKTPRRQNPGGGGGNTSKKRTKSVGKRSKAKSGKRGSGRSRKKK